MPVETDSLYQYESQTIFQAENDLCIVEAFSYRYYKRLSTGILTYSD
ncbi:hypothetical protein TDB9533_00803 [Thalassocella blandensis]|nr:hypothetical protein TDB9533_00803 [Thalassocella blandensis]